MSKMIQSREILTDLLAAMSQVMFLIRVEALKRGAKKVVTLAQNAALELAEKATEYDDNKGINKLNNKFRSSKVSGIALTKKETKDIIKVMTSLENRGILLKETTKKKVVKKEDFSIFLDH